MRGAVLDDGDTIALRTAGLKGMTARVMAAPCVHLSRQVPLASS